QSNHPFVVRGAGSQDKGSGARMLPHDGGKAVLSVASSNSFDHFVGDSVGHHHQSRVGSAHRVVDVDRRYSKVVGRGVGKAALTLRQLRARHRDQVQGAVVQKAKSLIVFDIKHLVQLVTGPVFRR